MRTVLRIVRWPLAALALAATVRAQAAERQAIVLADSGFVGVLRGIQDTVTVVAWHYPTRVLLRTDSATVARLAADSVAGDSAITITGSGDTIGVSVTRMAGGACRLAGRNGSHTLSIVFDSGGARTLWRVLGAPPAHIGFPDSAQRALVYTDLQVDNAATTTNPGQPPQYPTTASGRRISARVLVQFVVDTAGHVRLDTLMPLTAPDPALIQAVSAILPSVRYAPATLFGRPVDQLVVRPYDFIAPR
jgi:Gram-negative bacterial TonB protein C-terminal